MKDVCRWVGEEVGNYAGKVIFLIFFWKYARSRESRRRGGGREGVLTGGVHCVSQRPEEAEDH